MTRGERKEGTDIAFWNVAELGNKDREFWRELGQWDASVSGVDRKEGVGEGIDWGVLEGARGE